MQLESIRYTCLIILIMPIWSMNQPSCRQLLRSVALCITVCRNLAFANCAVLNHTPRPAGLWQALSVLPKSTEAQKHNNTQQRIFEQTGSHLWNVTGLCLLKAGSSATIPQFPKMRNIAVATSLLSKEHSKYSNSLPFRVTSNWGLVLSTSPGVTSQNNAWAVKSIKIFTVL